MKLRAQHSTHRYLAAGLVGLSSLGVAGCSTSVSEQGDAGATSHHTTAAEETRDCAGRDFSTKTISVGDKSQKRLIGACKTVTLRSTNVNWRVESAEKLIIEGDDNTITAGHLGSIVVEGKKNAVTWSSGAQTGIGPSSNTLTRK